MQWASGTGTTQSGSGTDTHWQCGTGTSTTASNNLNLAYFCTFKSRIRTRLFRDPKKLLIRGERGGGGGGGGGEGSNKDRTKLKTYRTSPPRRVRL